jgi:nucleoside triphosphate diphosphatase
MLKVLLRYLSDALRISRALKMAEAPTTALSRFRAAQTGSMGKALALMALLRDVDQGCPWDKEQNFSTIAPYTIEEAYEVADAIDRDDMHALREELGDLLFQVAFHTQMAEEQEIFGFADVVEALCSKMEERHPHVFVDVGARDTHARPDWEALKEQERTSKGVETALAGVALAYPALMRAEKLQKRAARVGFDWPDASGALAKIEEEIQEVRDAPDLQSRQEEIGDLLFAVVNWARKLDIDPEIALRNANGKFERRFRSMEAQSKVPLSDLDMDQLEELWLEAKRA